MRPAGIEPALKASEAFVLSIRLRTQMLQIYYITLTIISQNFQAVYTLLMEILNFIEFLDLRMKTFDFIELP